MNFITKWALAPVPGLALATPALALAPADQADLMQPGASSSSPNSSTCPRCMSTAVS
jgi:hypothetical protein